MYSINQINRTQIWSSSSFISNKKDKLHFVFNDRYTSIFLQRGIIHTSFINSFLFSLEPNGTQFQYHPTQYVFASPLLSSKSILVSESCYNYNTHIDTSELDDVLLYTFLTVKGLDITDKWTCNRRLEYQAISQILTSMTCGFSSR